jgi:hypothetical protein
MDTLEVMVYRFPINLQKNIERYSEVHTTSKTGRIALNLPFISSMTLPKTPLCRSLSKLHPQDKMLVAKAIELLTRSRRVRPINE